MVDENQDSTQKQEEKPEEGQAVTEEKDIDTILNETIKEVPIETETKTEPKTEADTPQEKTDKEKETDSTEDKSDSSENSLRPRADFNDEELGYFNSLDKKGQKTMLDRWHRFEKGFNKKIEGTENLLDVAKKFKEQYEPHLQNFKLNGIDPLQYNAQLLETAKFANEKPLEFIKWHLKNHKIDLQQLVQSPEEQDPTTEKIQNLEQQISGLNQNLQQRDNDAAVRKIENFKSAKDTNGNSLYPYFDTFKQQMAMKSQQTGEENLEKLYSQVFEDVQKVVDIEANKKMSEMQSQTDLQKAKEVGTPVKSSINSNVSEKKDLSLDEILNRNLS